MATLRPSALAKPVTAGHYNSADGQENILFFTFTASLKPCGVTADRIPALAREAAQQWTGGFNPRKVGVEEFTQLYQAAL